MTVTKQKIKAELKGELFSLIAYESKRIIKRAPLSVTVTLIISFFLTALFGRLLLFILPFQIQQVIQFSLLSSLGLRIIGGPGILSDELLEMFSFVPVSFRAYFALVFIVRFYLFSAASNLNSFLPMCVVPVAFINMLSTSTIKEEDIYPLLRVDRNKLLLTRSILNVLFYTFVVTATVWLTKTYIISSDPSMSMVSPFLEALTPILAIIPATFLFLLMLQSLTALINLYSSRAVYIIPSILLIELILQLLATMNYLSTYGSSSVFSQNLPLALSYGGNLEEAAVNFTLLIIFQLISNPMITIASILRFLFLFQLSGLMHVFSPLFGGVWNMNFFDPNYFLYNLFLSLRNTVFTSPLGPILTPYLALVILLIEMSKAPYYPWLNYLYVLVLPILLYSLTTILFGRRTL